MTNIRAYEILDSLVHAYKLWQELITDDYSRLNSILGKITAESVEGYIFSNESPARLINGMAINIPAALMDYIENSVPEISVETEMICKEIPFKSFRYSDFTFIVG